MFILQLQHMSVQNCAQFVCTIATHGQWLPYCSEQVQTDEGKGTDRPNTAIVNVRPFFTD